jgi:hypothetical protein
MAATQTTAPILTAEEIFRKCQISEGTLIESFFLRFYRKEHQEGEEEACSVSHPLFSS